jgi:hypothetical protein
MKLNPTSGIAILPLLLLAACGAPDMTSGEDDLATDIGGKDMSFEMTIHVEASVANVREAEQPIACFDMMQYADYRASSRFVEAYHQEPERTAKRPTRAVVVNGVCTGDTSMRGFVLESDVAPVKWDLSGPASDKDSVPYENAFKQWWDSGLKVLTVEISDVIKAPTAKPKYDAMRADGAFRATMYVGKNYEAASQVLLTAGFEQHRFDFGPTGNAAYYTSADFARRFNKTLGDGTQAQVDLFSTYLNVLDPAAFDPYINSVAGSDLVLAFGTEHDRALRMHTSAVKLPKHQVWVDHAGSDLFRPEEPRSVGKSYFDYAPNADLHILAASLYAPGAYTAMISSRSVFEQSAELGALRVYLRLAAELQKPSRARGSWNTILKEQNNVSIPNAAGEKIFLVGVKVCK